MRGEGEMVMTDTVLLEAKGRVRVITINRPDKLNALHAETQQRLLDRLQEVESDEDARALILTGAGEAFSSGGDKDLIREIVQGTFTDVDGLGRIHMGTIRTLLTLPVPVIAAVRGPAVGVAASIVALCDFVVIGEKGYLCDPNAKFGSAPHPECQLIWPLLTSHAFAKELLMSGRKVWGPEAYRVGLANRLCADGEELVTALSMAEEFVELPSGGLAVAKRACNEPILEQLVRVIDSAKETRELPNDQWLTALNM